MRASQHKSGYLPGLDGLRAFAILGVLMTHDIAWSVAGHSNEKWKGYGGWGVDLFFAISGVLICWRLLEDEARSGHISLGAFYIRRLFRIQPAAFAYLFVLAVLFSTHVAPSNWHYWWSAVFSYTNFVITANTPPAAAAFLGHFWTLSVEEHFYVLISLCFLVAKRYRAVLLTLLLVLLELGQMSAEHRGLYSPVDSARRTYWVVQFLLFPAFLVLIVRTPKARSIVEEFGKPWVATLLIASMMTLNLLRDGTSLLLHEFRHFSPVFFFSYNMDLLFYGFGVWIIAIMLHPRSLTTRFLELRGLKFLGRLSYSIYLWHILFFVPIYVPDKIHSNFLLTLCGRPWKYLATGAVALFSYYLVEKPLIRFGHKLAPPATAGHQDLSVNASTPKAVFPPEPIPAELTH